MAAEKGGRVVALTLPVLVPMNMSFLNHCGLFLIPGWGEILRLPVDERMVKLAEPQMKMTISPMDCARIAGDVAVAVAGRVERSKVWGKAESFRR